MKSKVYDLPRSFLKDAVKESASDSLDVWRFDLSGFWYYRTEIGRYWRLCLCHGDRGISFWRVGLGERIAGTDNN